MVKIVTWNVNSIKARLPIVLNWLQDTLPDVVLLQEIKTMEEGFPFLDLSSLGYQVAVSGQKTYNGVAILSRNPIDVIVDRLPGDESDTQARYIEAMTGGIRVASIYLPNGNPVDTDKFPYKLSWMERLLARVKTVRAADDATVFGGDYNVAPNDTDVYAPVQWHNDALCRPESRGLFRRLLHTGLTDALNAAGNNAGTYTWWDYRGGAWQRDHGLRIDHLLLTPQAADRFEAAGVDRSVRNLEKASDHAPVWCVLED